jgi:sRNA-binding regulator protein Hfq
MTEMSNNLSKRFRDALRTRKVQIVGLITAGVGMTAPVAAADTFNFSILTDLGTALVSLIPTANQLVDEGAPLVIKVCVVGAVCAPFVWLYYKANGHH